MLVGGGGLGWGLPAVLIQEVSAVLNVKRGLPGAVSIAGLGGP